MSYPERIKDSFFWAYRESAYKYRMFKSKKMVRDILKNQNISCLSQNEKRELSEYWKQFGCKPDYRFAQMMYGISGIRDPRFIVEPFFYYRINDKLCNFNLNMAWEDKNFYDIHFPGAPFPETIVHNIHGRFYDCNYEIISEDDAINYIKNEDEIIIKPSLETGASKNVRHLRNYEELGQVLKTYKSDFVVQKVIRQHESLSKLNNSAVNVFRVNTLRLENEIVLLPSYLRVIANDSSELNNEKDGVSIGLNHQLAIGLDSCYQLKNRAFNFEGQVFSKCLNGASFAAIKIPGCENMIKTVMELHKKIMYADIVSWDVTINENGLPAIIEINLGTPGCIVGQYCNGPFLGKYTDAVLRKVFI
ncbi:MAG: sugar-transfer associated ATP-grasp domain-containing protein [Candidatus Limivicinus sp.]|jgi:hypothetical protein